MHNHITLAEGAGYAGEHHAKQIKVYTMERATCNRGDYIQ